MAFPPLVACKSTIFLSIFLAALNFLQRHERALVGVCRDGGAACLPYPSQGEGLLTKFLELFRVKPEPTGGAERSGPYSRLSPGAAGVPSLTGTRPAHERHRRKRLQHNLFSAWQCRRLSHRPHCPGAAQERRPEKS